MKTEMESLKINDVWELVELPEDRKVIGSKWVFRVKTDADGKVETHKARLVAQGFSQTFGDDYDETFSPVARFESIRTVIALAAKYGLKLHQMDVTTAFLNGDVYMKYTCNSQRVSLKKEKNTSSAGCVEVFMV